MTERFRPLRYEAGLAYITLTRGLEAIIDEADADLVANANWHAVESRNTFYAQAKVTSALGGRTTKSLHQLILPAPDGLSVDHINGNGLDNRRANLRIATVAENCRNRGLSKNNTSGARGVSFNQRKQKWHARILEAGVRKHLGYFDSLEEAQDAFVAASSRLWGEFGAPR